MSELTPEEMSAAKTAWDRWHAGLDPEDIPLMPPTWLRAWAEAVLWADGLRRGVDYDCGEINQPNGQVEAK